MSDDPRLQELLERARSGEYDPHQELLDYLRRCGGTSPDALLQLARSQEPASRRAALDLAGEVLSDELLEAFSDLVRDDAMHVRLALARGLELNAWPVQDHVVAVLLEDSESEVRVTAVRVARIRAALQPKLVERLATDDYWRVRQEIARALGQAPPEPVLPALLRALAADSDNDVQAECAASLESHFITLGRYPESLPRPPLASLREAQANISRMRAGHCPLFAAWLQERVETDVDVEELTKYGTLLTLEARAGSLPRAYEMDALLDEVVKVLLGKAPRAAVLVGEAGAGKTALVHELTYRLADKGWHVLRVSPSDFLVGTVYLGEWETKLRKLIEAAKFPRKVILYIPNLEELATVGVTAKSDMNVATALAPHIERGDVTVIGESTVESFRKGLGAIRSLRRLFHAVQIPPTEDEETRDILRAVADESGLDVPAVVLDRLMELADFYSGGTAQPGRSVGLLRRVLGSLANETGPLTERHVLTTITSSTGIPVDFLDDAVPLDRAKVRGHFEARVMGQPEAVEAVIDLVTLVKAGLTDPNKPFGVLLFVGPTGVGKTELARALAELLFGDPGRMTRLDMSEYATYEAYERLIGQGGNPGLLTAAVRERPFSVLLLDEIEKAHLNVFDLCLQIFDAGRLTDAQGRTADFRRSIIILTSNVGSRIATEVPVGFGRSAPPPPDGAVTMRELARSFRPEFLNRIDRVVQFRPLSAETAERIARREVARVLERSGIARRKLVVDVEPSLFPLLLREGYSPAYGARPLKRTVERLVLLPVAQAIASGQAAAGSLLRLLAKGSRVEVDISPLETSDGSMPTAPSMPQRAASVLDHLRQLGEEIAGLRDRAGPLGARKSLLLEQLAAAGAWHDRRVAEARSDEVFRIDGVLAKLSKLEQELRQAEDTLERRPRERELARLEESLDALAGRVRLVGALVICRDPQDLGDALIILSRIGSQRGNLDSVTRLSRMYVRLAERLELDATVLDDHRTEDPVEDVVALQVAGAGAHALLRPEQGLHHVLTGKPATGDGRKGTVREVVRVEVFPLPLPDAGFRKEDVHAILKPLHEVSGRLLERPRFEVHLTHEPSMTTVHGWTDRTRQEAVESLRPLLHARVTANHEAATGRVVRRYTLGPSPLVRDARSGRSTGRLDEVLDGSLDQFFVAES